MKHSMLLYVAMMAVAMATPVLGELPIFYFLALDGSMHLLLNINYLTYSAYCFIITM